MTGIREGLKAANQLRTWATQDGPRITTYMLDADLGGLASSACAEPTQTTGSGSRPPAVEVTPQLERLYQRLVLDAHARFMALAPGSSELSETRAPASFSELLVWMQRGWVVPTGDQNHPVMNCLVALGSANYWTNKGYTAFLKVGTDLAQRLYNNALVEVYVDAHEQLHRNVYLPSHGIAPIETRLVELYNELGYRVVFIPYMWEAGCGTGAVDCLTSELRGPLFDPMRPE